MGMFNFKYESFRVMEIEYFRSSVFVIPYVYLYKRFKCSEKLEFRAVINVSNSE